MTRDSANRCRVPKAFWRTLDHLGLRPGVVLRQARLPSTLHLSATGFVTTAQLFAIWKAVEDLAGPEFGFKMVKASDEAGHQPAFLAAHYAADFRDAISRIDRFKRLGSCEVFRFEERNGEFSISKEWPYAAEPEPAVLVDMSFAYLLELGRRGTGHKIVPLRVELARPDTFRLVYDNAFECPIRYSAPRNLIILRSSDLDRPFPGHNAEFLELLTPALTAALGDLHAQSTVGEQVKAVLKRSLASGRPDVAAVARDLGMSERTLQRRVTDDGSTFRTLLAEARQELGRLLLADPAMEIDEIACMLGYQDTSSFYRGFREREGVTPSRWRALHTDTSRGASASSLIH